MANVVHCKKAPQGSFVYIGRPHLLGNPYPLADPKNDVQRKDVIEKYRTWLDERVQNDPAFREALNTLRGQDLGCWCAPRACHGDVIMEWLQNNPA
jgi:hypothetical protein